MAARAIDKHRPLDFRGDADQRPARDFAFGDKGDRRNRADNENIGPRYMIGNVENSTVMHRRAVHVHTYAEQCAQHAIVIRSDEAPTGQSKLAKRPLE